MCGWPFAAHDKELWMKQHTEAQEAAYAAAYNGWVEKQSKPVSYWEGTYVPTTQPNPHPSKKIEPLKMYTGRKFREEEIP